MLKHLLIFLILFFNYPVYPQQDNIILDNAELLLKSNKYEEAKLLILDGYNKNVKNIDYSIFLAKIYSKSFKKDSCEYWLDKANKLIGDTTTSKQLFQYYLWKGYNYDVNKNYDEALENYFLAKKRLYSIKDAYYIDLLYQRILLLYSENNKNNATKEWIYAYTKINDSLKNNYFSSSYHNVLGKHFHYKKQPLLATNHFNEAIKYSKKNEDSIILSNAYFNKGIIFAEYLKNQDSAQFYYSLGKRTNPTKNNKLFKATYNYNMSRTYLYKDDLKNAKKWLLKILRDTIPPSRKFHIKNNVYRDLYDIYKTLKKQDSSYYYLELYNIYKDSLNIYERDKNLKLIQAKYNSEKDKNRILNLELSVANTKQNSNRIIAVSSFLVLLGLISGVILFLIQKNTKKKQKLAEQDKALEKQKVATLLKDQEINNINAMIEGQEKERQRIANDLHDDLGGLMATIKLQFNTLQEQQTPDLFDKTNNLLDQAYNKIRSIAHAKNSGVIAKQGLLKAVKNMARNVSSASVIDIEVTDFGLESRLENSLELSIFRIIQELTTNIIKHAEATHATISLTNHENSLNIMIEDNGKGFNANKVIKSNGMGLHSIEKRVEHLEGELKIESQINQGTTIIIDIPL
ncbi:tetratricopeptide repeat-containing sensor histidine kinase [Pontimicrobium sp. MEBiC01747]